MNRLTRPQGAVVVVMAKRPEPGRTKTRLCPPLSPSDAAELYEAMLGDTIALAAAARGAQLAIAVTPASALDVWRPDVPEGTLILGIDGPTIGECLETAATELFNRGCSPVMAVNSDGPTLPRGRIEAACALLDTHDVVLGPSDDGGYYLIGLARPQPTLFRDVPWSTPVVADLTRSRARELELSFAELPRWYDVDTAADLHRLRVELASLPADVAPRTRRFFADRSASLAPAHQRASEVSE
ncbi:MAG: TIGR04282 family arsenosugar biosynthesis glycosyltransferase [Bacteroidales bacterium]